MNLEFRRQTDRVHQVTLESRIIHAGWQARSAVVGQKGTLEVWTRFVGDGSEIRIRVEDSRGRTMERISGRVYANRFVACMAVPEKAKESLHFTVRLPDHGLEARSEVLEVIPRVVFRNVRWDRQQARRGEKVRLMADTENLPDRTEVLIRIYEQDPDGAHDLIAQFPVRVEQGRVEAEWQFEYPRDTEKIPIEEEMKKTGRHYQNPEYFFVVRYGGAEGRSDRLKFLDWIEFRFEDGLGGKRTNIDTVRIELPDGTEQDYTPDPEGSILIQDLPPGRITIKQVRMKKERGTG